MNSYQRSLTEESQSEEAQVIDSKLPPVAVAGVDGNSSMVYRNDSDECENSSFSQQNLLEEVKIHPSVVNPTISATDVLCGRGKISFNHVGNKHFREAISTSLQQYMDAESRFEKALVVHAIVDGIQQVGGRFLKKDHATGFWHELSRQQSREKVGHAVRDAVNSYESRAKKKQEKQQNPSCAIEYTTLLSPLDQMSREKRECDTDYSAGSRKRRRTASPLFYTEPSSFSDKLNQSPILAPTHLRVPGLSIVVPSTRKQSLVATPHQNTPQLHFKIEDTAPGMVARLPSNFQPSPINDQQKNAAALDDSHLQRRDERSINFSIRSPVMECSATRFHSDLRETQSSLPMAPHLNLGDCGTGNLKSQYDSRHHLDRMHHHDHLSQSKDESLKEAGNDHFLDAINAVLGPIPDGPHEAITSPDSSDPLSPLDPSEPRHPQHQLWLQQRLHRETLRRHQEQLELQRRRRPQNPG